MSLSNAGIEAHLDNILELLNELKNNQYDFLKNKVLTFDQGCKYLGYSKSTIYKFTSAGILPFSKPHGKTIFFDREKLERRMLSNPRKSREEIETATYVSTHPLKAKRK
jgi:excisionase family DNA binding protein